MQPLITLASRLCWLAAHVVAVLVAIRMTAPTNAAPRPVDAPRPAQAHAGAQAQGRAGALGALPPVTAPARERSAAPILARNPFDSKTGPLTGSHTNATARCGPEQLDGALRVVRLSGDEVRIPRRLIDDALEQQAELMRQTRVVPETKDGRIVGVRLFGVRPGTTLADVGFQNGDRVETINGYPVGSPEQALEAYAHLRAADYLVVKVRRRGELLALHMMIC